MGKPHIDAPLSAVSDRLASDLDDVVRAWQEPGQPGATFAAAGEAFRRHVGFRLYTITHVLPGGREVERVHSTDEASYPVGGRKPVTPNAFRDQVYGSKRPFLGRTPADFSPFFPDTPFIVSLGLGSVINIPLVFDGAALGSVNLLDREGAYDEAHLDPAMRVARLIMPALLRLSAAA
jgi:hypothetical protein